MYIWSQTRVHKDSFWVIRWPWISAQWGEAEWAAVFHCINLTGGFLCKLNIFLLKVQISSPAALSSSLISRSPMAKWKPLAASSIIQLLFGTKILSSTKAHIVQTATWTRRRALLFFVIYFSSNQREPSAAITWTSAAALRRLIVCSVCPSTPDHRHGLRDGLSCQRAALHVQGGNCSAIDEDQRGEGGLLTVGGINEGGLWTTTGSPDDAAAGGKTSITGKEWLLLMVWMLLTDDWKSLERRRQRSNC